MSHARACTKVAYVTNEEIYWPISHKKPAAICIISTMSNSNIYILLGLKFPMSRWQEPERAVVY